MKVLLRAFPYWCPLLELPASDELYTDPGSSSDQSQLRKPKHWSTLLVSSHSILQSLTVSNHVRKSAQAPSSTHDARGSRILESSDQDCWDSLDLVLDIVCMCALGTIEAERGVIGTVCWSIGCWVGNFRKLAVFACVGCVDGAEPERCGGRENCVT